MARKVSISDRTAKAKCMEYLRQLDYTELRIARRSEHCDVVGYKDGKKFYFEVKFSYKDSGKFFGCVMLTELHFAINNKEQYKFVVCRGDSEDIKGWFFRIFEVDEFLKLCTLTTPICHYHLYLEDDGSIRYPNFAEETIIVSDELIRTMWNNFQIWKKKQQE